MCEVKRKGNFTLPGEAGYEKLTLELAEKWGADVIRDSDGTVLSDEILDAGYGIYSTICMIRDHNEWARENQDKLQQCFLMTSPAVAVEGKLTVCLMEGFLRSSSVLMTVKMPCITGRYMTGLRIRLYRGRSGATTRRPAV